MSNFEITITINNQWSTNITWIMGGIRAGLRPISTSPITINNLPNIIKLIVSGLLRHTSTSCTITPTISSFKFIYTQQCTMFTWVIGGGGLDGMGPKSNSPITTNSFYHIAGGKLAGLFRPISTSTIINYYIPPQVSIITTSVYPPIIIIITDITILFFMNLFFYTTRRYWWIQQYTTVTWVMGVKVAGMGPISTYPFKINSCSPILIVRMAGLLWHISTSINITTIISSVIMREIVDGIKIPISATFAITWVIVAGLERHMLTYFITQRHFKTFFFVNYIVVITKVGGIMAVLVIPIS